MARRRPPGITTRCRRPGRIIPNLRLSRIIILNRRLSRIIILNRRLSRAITSSLLLSRAITLSLRLRIIIGGARRSDKPQGKRIYTARGMPHLWRYSPSFLRIRDIGLKISV